MNRTAGRLLIGEINPMREAAFISDSNNGSHPARQRTQVLTLRAGEWVEVLSAEEIFSTLDSNHCLDGLPFMPEMLQYCGRRFRVFKSAHKTCDTIESFAIRRMSSAVHLEGLRCDGEGHGGCQAGCLLFWKEAWLRRVSNGDSLATSSDRSREDALAEEIARLHASTRLSSSEPEATERFRCQATEVLNATTEVRKRDRWNPMFYLRDLTSGNVGFFDFIRFGVLAAFNAIALYWSGRRYPQVCGRAGNKTPASQLNLQAGEVVHVRSKDAIMATLNSEQRNRGLYFDVEMTPFCQNGEFKVLKRVERIIDEKTGRMLKIPNACLILDGVVCSGRLSSYRMFCPRSIYPYWREIWLERAGDKPQPIASGRRTA